MVPHGHVSRGDENSHVESITPTVAHEMTCRRRCEMRPDHEHGSIRVLCKKTPPGRLAHLSVPIGTASPVGIRDLGRMMNQVACNDGLLTA